MAAWRDHISHLDDIVHHKHRLRRRWFRKMYTTDSTRISTFTIRIMAPKWTTYLKDGMNDHDAFEAFDKANQEVVDGLLGGSMSEIEERLSTMLPDGFYAKIDG